MQPRQTKTYYSLCVQPFLKQCPHLLCPLVMKVLVHMCASRGLLIRKAIAESEALCPSCRNGFSPIAKPRASAPSSSVHESTRPPRLWPVLGIIKFCIGNFQNGKKGSLNRKSTVSTPLFLRVYGVMLSNSNDSISSVVRFGVNLYFHLHPCLLWLSGYFPRAAETKHYKLDCLKHQQFILSQLGRLKVGNQGAGKVDSFWGRRGGICSVLLSWLPVVIGGGHHFLACSYIFLTFASVLLGLLPCFFPVCPCVHVSFF